MGGSDTGLALATPYLRLTDSSWAYLRAQEQSIINLDAWQYDKFLLYWLYKKGELIKNSKKIWFCVGTYTNKQDCENSIVTTKEDLKLQYGGGKRYYLCYICNSKNKKREDKVLTELFTQIAQVTKLNERKGN